MHIKLRQHQARVRYWISSDRVCEGGWEAKTEGGGGRKKGGARDTRKTEEKREREREREVGEKG